MIDSLLLYFQFFTRIPIPVPIDEPEEKMRSGVRFFSLFGLLLGLLELLIYYVLHQMLNPGIAWIMVLFFDVLLTGGFHLDALSDMADGLFSSRKPERMLEIMKDSRVGSNGVLAIVFYYLFMIFTFYTLLPQLAVLQRVAVVLLLNVVGKNGISVLFYHMNYAGKNPEGVGTTFLNVKPVDIGICQLFTLSMLLLFFGRAGAGCFAIHLVSVLGYRQLVMNKIGGFNGDTLGACSPIAQVVFLLSLLGLRGWL
ncbi:adenosylcobinamide-GDP ribazoletransferase [Enterococcus florum]|uniref:Adenosylcobinamide-GDP ribazoletransferase n=1 Tax=Enterococcus florum TaxID=2480627 RepID=A0A4P5PBT9_9ENTE|nr:adenosylcobinamide-GDP ribazoletransferase [Enterococcus florum]GCF95216.1 adenosylcobinamide-GDP ribazoletransferase [Enterococcus florum]